MKLDASLLADIFREEGRTLIAVTTRRTRDAELSLDIIGETFAIAFERRGAFRGRTREEAISWVHAIARNTLLDHYRRGGAERRALQRLGVDPPAMGEDERRRVEQLADGAGSPVIRELELLPAEQQQAVQLRVVEEISYDEIARRLNVTAQVVRARVSRGLRALANSPAVRKETEDARSR